MLFKQLKRKTLENIPIIVEGIPSSEHTQDPDISSILECIESKISTEFGSNQCLDVDIMMRLSSLSVALDSCIQNLVGYTLELDENRKSHDLSKLKMQSVVIMKNKALAQVIKSFKSYQVNLTQVLIASLEKRANTRDISDHN